MKNWLKKLKQSYKERRFKKYTNMTPQEIFTEAYLANIWGGENGTFYSGNGTTDPKNADYIRVVKEFILANKITSIVEIGCGDFRIMKQLLSDLKDVNSLGLDIVPTLIDYNNNHFKTHRISFLHANAISDEIPTGDLIIIRQVLQHLQNTHIKKILDKISGFKYALITEHVVITPNAIPNLDKITGPHIRSRINSGVYIDQPPFSIPNSSVLFEYRADEKMRKKIVPAVIRTYFVKNEQH